MSDTLDPIRSITRHATLTLGASQTTREERASVAQALAAAIPQLATLAAAEPAEWSGLCATWEVAGGFSTHLRAIKQAVAAAVVAHRASVRATRATAYGGPDDIALRSRLSRTQQGSVKPCYANLITILRGDPEWASLQMSSLGDVTEHHGAELIEGPGTAVACEWLRDKYGVDATEGAVKSALYAVAQSRKYSPIKRYLDSVRSSAGDAIARILPDVLGITDATDAQRAMLGRFLISAVARALDPGCKVDTALILVGEQAAKKSTFFETLFGEWFGDSPIPIGNKDAPIQMQRVWGYECQELEDLTTRKSVDAVKQYMSTRRDLYRPPFARTAVLVPRHTVLCGSCNRPEFLEDSTGDRRFWVLTIPAGWTIPVSLLTELRGRIWAEALADYEAGERWWFDRDEEAVRADENERYRVLDDWTAPIEAWLARAPEDGTWTQTPGALGNFTRAAVLAGIGIPPGQWDQRATRRVAAILRRLSWVEVASPSGHRGARVWRREP